MNAKYIKQVWGTGREGCIIRRVNNGYFNKRFAAVKFAFESPAFDVSFVSWCAFIRTTVGNREGHNNSVLRYATTCKIVSFFEPSSFEAPKMWEI